MAAVMKAVMTASMIDTTTGHWNFRNLLKSKVFLVAELWLVSQSVPSEAGQLTSTTLHCSAAVLHSPTCMCTPSTTGQHHKVWGKYTLWNKKVHQKYSLKTIQLRYFDWRSVDQSIAWTMCTLTHVREIQLLLIVVEYNWYSWCSIRSQVSRQSPSKGLSAYQANLT